uniref:Uncharacterized protein n=1 Tax=Arundo donax TaxID=35708 RepID=A0A0A9ESQ9_ARUDO
MDGGGEPEVGDGASEPDKPPEPEVHAQAQEPLAFPLLAPGVGQEPSAAED